MANINEIKKEFGEIKKEISRLELAEKTTEVMNESPIKDLIESNPVMLLALMVFSAELDAKIFREDIKKENTSTEESEG